MENEIKLFFVKLVSVVLSLILLYYLFSPYERCVRDRNWESSGRYGDPPVSDIQQYFYREDCREVTSW